jgi:hypothetical protein
MKQRCLLPTPASAAATTATGPSVPAGHLQPRAEKERKQEGVAVDDENVFGFDFFGDLLLEHASHSGSAELVAALRGHVISEAALLVAPPGKHHRGNLGSTWHGL